MSWTDRLRNLLGGAELERGIDEELQFHIDERARENVEAGMAPEQARREAVLAFGSRADARERTREADVVMTLDTLAQDVAYGCRSLRKHAGFTLVVVLTLALGIGANAAIFTLVHGVLMRPLPFPASEELFAVTYGPRGESPPGSFSGLSDRHYLALREAQPIFEATTTYAAIPVTLTGAGDPARLSSAVVTPDFFRVLRVGTALGRTLVPGDDAPGQEPIVVLGDALWRSRFGGSPDVIGKRVAIDGVPHTVVGVLPSGFSYPPGSELWTPLAVRIDPHMSLTRPVIGRAKPDSSEAQLRSAWQTLVRGLPLDTQDGAREWSASLLPLRDAVVRSARKPLLLFAGAVAFVLLIACANVSNLLLMHASSRRQEILTRLALGAGRARVVRQLLVESAVLSLLGGVAALVVALVSLPSLLAIVPGGRLPRLSEVRIDGWTLAFTFGLSIACGLLLGLGPALHATRESLSRRLRQDRSRMTRRSDRLRQTLVVGEVALALVLAVGAGLFARSFLRLSAVDPGFRTSQVMTMTIDLPESRYEAAPRIHDFADRLLARLEALPGVESAGLVNWLPLDDMLIRGDLELAEGRSFPSDLLVTKACVTPGYRRAMRIRLTNGRDFTSRDVAGAPGVAMVSESLARRLWPGEDALGQRLSIESQPGSDWLTVVGVVSDVRQGGLDESVMPAVYQPYGQVNRPFFLNHMTVALRSTVDPRAMGASLLAALREVDKDLAPHRVASMDDRVAGTLAEPRFQARLFAVFSLLAMALAAIGVHGVLSYAVSEQEREMAVRMALGADRGKLVAMVLRRVLLLAVAGVVLGLAGALALGRLLAQLLFEVRPTDIATLAGASALLVAVSLVAGWVPARRASGVDPMTALRAE